MWFIDKCWPGLISRFPSLQFNIAGRNAPKWLIKNFDKPGINFHGEIANAYDFMDRNGIMVVPLFSGSGMRIKIIEAMAMQKPVLATPIGCEGIPVQHGKNIYLARNEKDFIEGIELLISNQLKREELGRESYKLILKNYDNFAISKSLLQFYNKLIHGISDHILD